MLSAYELQPASKVQPLQVISLPQGGRKLVILRLRDANGVPVNLTKEPPKTAVVPGPVFEHEPLLSGLSANVKLIARERYGSRNVVIEKTGTIDDERVTPLVNGGQITLADGSVCCPEGNCTGIVSFELLESDTVFAGIYTAEIGLFAGEFLSQSFPLLIKVEPSLFANCGNRLPGQVTILDVREALQDFPDRPGALLDGVEFSDGQIMWAMGRVVDLWNETPPPVAYYTSENFPYRNQWITATFGYLCQSAAAGYRRNQLAYSAGGVTMDDQNKYQQYEQIAEIRLAEFREFMKTEKVRINMGLAYSSWPL